MALHLSFVLFVVYRQFFQQCASFLDACSIANYPKDSPPCTHCVSTRQILLIYMKGNRTGVNCTKQKLVRMAYDGIHYSTVHIQVNCTNSVTVLASLHLYTLVSDFQQALHVSSVISLNQL